MDQGILVIIVVVVLLGLVLAGSLASRRRLALFEQDCRDRGWQVERAPGPAFDQRISGTTDGIAWEYQYYRLSRGGSGRRNVGASETRRGRWHTEAASLPGDIVLIVPRGGHEGQLGQTLQAMKQFGGLGRKVVELLVVTGLQGDPSDVDVFMALQDVQAGSDALRAKFSLLATSEDAAARLVRQGEAPLMDYVMNPSLKPGQRAVSVLLWRKGLTLPAERQITDAAHLEAMAKLGAGLANAVKGW